MSRLGHGLPIECHICCKFMHNIPSGALQRARHGSMVFGLYYKIKSSAGWRPLYIAEGAAYRGTHLQTEHIGY